MLSLSHIKKAIILKTPFWRLSLYHSFHFFSLNCKTFGGNTWQCLEATPGGAQGTMQSQGANLGLLHAKHTHLLSELVPQPCLSFLDSRKEKKNL